MEPRSGALYALSFSRTSPRPSWQQTAAMPLYGQDSAHSERILAKLFLALLPAVYPTGLSVKVQLGESLSLSTTSASGFLSIELIHIHLINLTPGSQTWAIEQLRSRVLFDNLCTVE